jgi:hypothetical protein
MAVKGLQGKAVVRYPWRPAGPIGASCDVRDAYYTSVLRHTYLSISLQSGNR